MGYKTVIYLIKVWVITFYDWARNIIFISCMMPWSFSGQLYGALISKWHPSTPMTRCIKTICVTGRIFSWSSNVAIEKKLRRDEKRKQCGYLEYLVFYIFYIRTVIWYCIKCGKRYFLCKKNWVYVKNSDF